MTPSCPPAYYDEVYRTAKRYGLSYRESPYYLLWLAALELLPKNRDTRILEIGCGPGQFAEMLRDTGYQSYTGVDSSPVAVDMAAGRGITCVCQDAFDYMARHTDYDVLLALETMEHLDDLALLKLVPAGKLVTLSVPNFEDESHLRHFASARMVRDWYAPYLFFIHLGSPLHVDGRRWYLGLGVRILPREGELCTG